MLFERIRTFFQALWGGWDRMKPERIQRPLLPETEIPMTVERIDARAAEVSFDVVETPVAIHRSVTFDSFAEAAAFVHLKVGPLAEEHGYTPKVEINGATVDFVLGIPIPNLLSEGDFDFAAELGKVISTSERDETA